MEDMIYWFGEHYTEYEVLVNIYILLFLYCVGTLTLKFITILKNTSFTGKRR